MGFLELLINIIYFAFLFLLPVLIGVCFFLLIRKIQRKRIMKKIHDNEWIKKHPEYMALRKSVEEVDKL